MTSDVLELYQQVILEHNRHPRNFRTIEGGQRAEGHNPLCGDHLTVYVRVERGVITDLSFQGSGCAIAKASASLMTDLAKGRAVADARALAAHFERLVTAPVAAPLDDLGTLSVFAGVRRFPIRATCALLAWRAMRAAVDSRDEPGWQGRAPRHE